MQIPGIPHFDPSSINTTISALTKGTNAVYDYILGQKKKDSEESKDSIVDVVVGIQSNLDDNIPKLVESGESISANTLSISNTSERILASLEQLNRTLSDSEVNINLSASGITSEVIKSFVDNSSDDNTVTRIKNFTAAIIGSIKDIAAESDKIDKYNATVDAVVSGFSKFSEISTAGILKAVTGIAAGIAAVGLATYFVISKISLQDIGKFALFGAVFGGVAWLLGQSGPNVLKASAAVATLGISIWAFSKILTTEMITTTALALAAVGGSIWIFSKIADPKTLLQTSLGIAVMGLSLWGLSEVLKKFADIEWDDIAKAGVVIGGISVLMIGLGVPAVAGLALAGTAVIAAIAGASWLLAAAIGEIGKLSDTGEGVDNFVSGTWGVMKSMMMIGNPLTLPLMLAGAASAALVGGGASVLASAINKISAIKIAAPEHFEKFKVAIDNIADTIKGIGGPIATPLIIAGFASAVPLAGAAVVLSGALHVLSKVNIPSAELFDSYAYGVGRLSETIKDIGGPIATPLILAGTAAAAAMSVGTIAMATSIRVFSAIAGDPADVDNALNYLRTFISSTTDIFTAHSNEDYEKVRVGIRAMSGVSNLVGAIAKSVADVANLTFSETAVENGKLVVKSTHKLTEEDFKRVGNSIGFVISALTEPLSKIGSATEGILFKSNKVADGISALSGLGAVFNPLSAIVGTFSAKKIDEASAQNFSSSLKIILSGISSAFSSADKLNKSYIQSISKSVDALGNLVSIVSNNKISSSAANVSKLGTAVGVLKKSLNEIDAAKLTKFNDVLSNMQKLDENKGFEKLATAIIKLIEKLAEIQQTGSSSAPQIVNNTYSHSSTPQIVKQERQEKARTDELMTLLESGNAEVSAILSQLYELFVSGQVKVKTVPVNM